MEALAGAGDRAGAVAHGKAHLELLQREFDLDPDAELEQLIESLRETAPAATRRRDIARPHANPASETQLAPQRPTTMSALARRTTLSRQSPTLRRRAVCAVWERDGASSSPQRQSSRWARSPP
jgi:hypothetical protein